jgi:hypothetical protein
MGLVENGKVLIEPMYDNLDFNNNNRIVAKKNNLCGLISTTNNIIIPFLYTEIEPDWEENRHAENKKSIYYWTAKNNIETKYISDIKQNRVVYYYDNDVPMMVYELPNGKEAENKKREIELGKQFASAKIVDVLSAYFYVTNKDGEMGVYNYFTKKIVVPLKFDSILLHEEIKNANYCTVYKNGKVGFYNADIELLSLQYDFIITTEIKRGLIFPVKNNLYGLNFLTDEMDLNIKPTYRMIKYHNRFLVKDDWIFNLFKITDALGRTYFMGENKKEYISK